MSELTCAGCQSSVAAKPTRAGNLRLPRGWKRLPAGPLCGECKAGRYVLRAVTLPVARPFDLDWPALRGRLAAAWSMSTALANWSVAELAKADVVRTAGVAKLPKMPAVYLYGLFNRHFADRALWAGASQGVIALLNGVDRKYRAARYETVWLRSASTLSFRHPHPYPVDAGGWSASWSEDGRKVPLVSICLPGGRVTLQLRREASLGRQLAMFGQIASGAALPGEAALYRQAKGGSRRNGVAEREPGGGREAFADVMLKLVAYFPRKAPGERLNTMLVRTDPAALWVAEVEGHPPWILNADHARRKAAEHRVKLQRTGEDTKAEKRVPPELRRRISELRQVWARRYNDFTDTFTHTASKQLAEYAARQKCAEVIYDDKVQTYMPGFPWFQLRERLRYKLDERGIRLTAADDVEDEDESAA